MSAARLPAVKLIASALRSTTELLAREVVTPTPIAPQWTELEWDVARAVCAMHGFGALLANRLRWRGPDAWIAFLEDQREHGRAHYERAGKILTALDTAAREAGISVIALKGSALRALDLHLPGERPMGDIDLLVEPREVAACAAMLAQIEYEPAFSTRRHDIFVPLDRQEAHPFAEHVRNPLKIELHTRIAECLPVSEVEITAMLWPSRTRPGINGYASTAALMRHLLLHTAGNVRAHALRFIQLYDIAQLARRMQADDWRELLGTADSRADAWWIYPPLSLAERYVPGSIPPEILAAFGALCPRGLRARARRHTLYEVSWSNLRIGALPGHEWARTPLELLRFAKSRVLPGRVALQELADVVRAYPSYTQVRWYGVSHAERMLRWLIFRPPRVQTILSVRAALESST